MLGQLANQIEEKLVAAFAPDHLEVVDESYLHAGHSGARPEGETHFRVIIVAVGFEGLSRLERQRVVGLEPQARGQRAQSAGGVVRVEATDLHWVGNTFAEHMGERTIKLVREVAGVPGQYVWAAKATSAARSASNSLSSSRPPGTPRI